MRDTPGTAAGRCGSLAASERSETGLDLTAHLLLNEDGNSRTMRFHVSLQTPEQRKIIQQRLFCRSLFRQKSGQQIF